MIRIDAILDKKKDYDKIHMGKWSSKNKNYYLFRVQKTVKFSMA